MIQIFASRNQVDQNETSQHKMPVFTVVTTAEEYSGMAVRLTGRSYLRYDADRGPGRRIWIETNEMVVVENGDCPVYVFP